MSRPEKSNCTPQVLHCFEMTAGRPVLPLVSLFPQKEQIAIIRDSSLYMRSLGFRRMLDRGRVLGTPQTSENLQDAPQKKRREH